MVFFCSSGAPRDLHSFPTRRSSDLVEPLVVVLHLVAVGQERGALHVRGLVEEPEALVPVLRDLQVAEADLADALRSEEHTSELQSQSNLVCRLLLEKKKNTGRSRLE